MTTIDNQPSVCLICDRPEQGHMFQHPFTTEASGTDWLKTKRDKKPDEATAPVVSSFPFDPVVRQALVNKGVLSVDDLNAAEQQIRAIGGMLNGH